MHQKRYNVIGLGGTFDHFHAGHEVILAFAGRLAKQVVIGITADHMTAHKPFAQSIEPLAVRQRSVKHFCQKHSIKSHIEVLNDLYGSTLDEHTPIEALAVTAETIQGAEKINEARIQLHQPPFPIHQCAMVKDETGQILHSERIRGGEVSRGGTVFVAVLKHTIKLTEKQRNYLRQPYGEIVLEPTFLDRHKTGNITHRPFVAVVGDVSLELFLANNWPFDLGIYDGQSQRKPYHSLKLQSLSPTLQCTNPPGSITKELIQTLTQIKQQQTYIFVQGEEDLAAAVLLLLLPLQAVIFFGDVRGGMRQVEVDETLKKKIYSIFP